MAVTSVRTCDACGTNRNVDILTGVYGRKAFEADLCSDCYEKMTAGFAKSIRRPTRATIKPQHRFKKTDVDKSAL